MIVAESAALLGFDRLPRMVLASPGFSNRPGNRRQK